MSLVHKLKWLQKVQLKERLPLFDPIKKAATFLIVTASFLRGVGRG